MRFVLTILFFSICFVATSGRQNSQLEGQTDLISKIQKAADSTAIDAARQIDSMLLPGKVLIRIDDYPLPYGAKKRHYWYYLVKRGDTSFTHFR